MSLPPPASGGYRLINEAAPAHENRAALTLLNQLWPAPLRR